MALRIYREGLASITSSPGGLTQVRFTGALLTTAVMAGDTFFKAGLMVPIEEVTDDETLVLAVEWEGAEFTEEAYGILQNSPDRETVPTLNETLLDVIERYKRLFETSVPLKSVKEYGVTSPPVGAVEDDVYVVASSGTSGVFAGHEDEVAIKTANGWVFLAPEHGWHIDSEVDGAGTNVVRHWDGTQWDVTGALAAAPDFVGNWSSATAYTPAQIVLRLGKLYIANTANTNQAPENNIGDEWEVYASIQGLHGGFFAVHYTWRTDTTQATASTAGNMNAGSALSSTTTMVRASVTDIFGAAKSDQLVKANTASSSSVKGRLRIVVPGDGTKEFTADVSSCALAGSNLRVDFVVTNATNVGTIADGTEVVLIFSPKGDKGDTGADSTVAGPQGSAGGPFAIPFEFDPLTADAAPASGKVRLGSETQNTSTVLRVNDAAQGGASIVDLILDISDADNAPLAKGRLYKADDPTGAFLTFNVTAVSDLSGYTNLTIEVLGSSEANPFADGDDLILDWVTLYKGVQGDQGIQGEQGEAFQPDHVVATLDLRDAYDEAAAGTSVLVEDDSAHGNIPILYFLITPGVASPFSAAVWSQGFSFAPGADTSSITHGAGTLEEALDRLFDLAEGVMPDVASAATLDVSAIDAPFARVTGTTGITAITMRAGQQIWLQWAAAGAVTHNGTTLPLNGGVSRTNEVNAFSKFVSDGSGVPREAYYSGGRVRYDIAQSLTAAQQRQILQNSGFTSEVDVASAATCDIGAAASVKVRITGTTTITSFGSAANAIRFIRFAGALTLTHHATSLFLPYNGSNITTAAGDTAIAVSDASGNWRVLHYTRAADGSGIYTPTVTLVGGGGNVPPVYTINSGRWTRKDNRIFVDIHLEGDGGNEGAGTGQINISLPVTASASAGTRPYWMGTALNGSNSYMINAELGASASAIGLAYFSAITTNASFTGALQNNTTRWIRLNFNYEV